MTNAVALWLDVGLLSLLWGFALWSYQGLPDHIPVHFGISGAPDRWVDKGLGEWLRLPIVGLVMTSLFCGIGFLMGRVSIDPAKINLPSGWKARFMAAPEDRRRAVMDILRGLFYWQGVPMNVMFCWILVDSWRVATARALAISPAGPLTLAAAFMAIVVLHLFAFRSAIMKLPAP